MEVYQHYVLSATICIRLTHQAAHPNGSALAPDPRVWIPGSLRGGDVARALGIRQHHIDQRLERRALGEAAKTTVREAHLQARPVPGTEREAINRVFIGADEYPFGRGGRVELHGPVGPIRAHLVPAEHDDHSDVATNQNHRACAILTTYARQSRLAVG